MYNIIAQQGCKNYKPSDENRVIFTQSKDMVTNCKECVYFSSKNCMMGRGLDTNDSSNCIMM